MKGEILNIIIYNLLSILFTFIGIYIKDYSLKNKLKKFNLYYHNLFFDIKESINNIKNWSVKENRIVFIHALIIKLQIWLDEGKKLIDYLEKENYNFNKKELKKVIYDWAYNAIDLYNLEWEKKGIHKVIINYINQYHQKSVDKFVDEINKIIEDDIYYHNKFKVIGVFDILRTLLFATINDFQDFVYREKFNGRFKNVFYNNIPINDDEFENYKKNKL